MFLGIVRFSIQAIFEKCMVYFYIAFSFFIITDRNLDVKYTQVLYPGIYFTFLFESITFVS